MSKRRVELTKRFIKDLNNLDKNTQRRIISVLYKLRDGEAVDLRRIRGTNNEWRIRVGVYRIRIKITGNGVKVYALRVLHRREVYLDF